VIDKRQFEDVGPRNQELEMLRSMTRQIPVGVLR